MPYSRIWLGWTFIKSIPCSGLSKGLYNRLPSICNATYCPQADWGGCVLRMAGHDFMDFRDGEGGSDGCVDLQDEDNNGLAQCLYEGEFGISVADAFAPWCTQISLADFLVIAAESVMNISRKHVTNDDPSRSTIDFKSQFAYGRTTALNCAFAHGRLPNPENSCTDVKNCFVDSMGLDWWESAALMGVHTLGRAQIANSGYNGWWSDAENSRRFNNDYYASIVLKGWGPETAVNGNTNKNQWKRIDQGADEAGLGKEMMLNSDMCLYFTMDDDGLVEMDAATAAENTCECTWVAYVKFQQASNKYMNGTFCGSHDIPGAAEFPRQRSICCGEEFDKPSDLPIDCGLVIEPLGPAVQPIRMFANDEELRPLRAMSRPFQYRASYDLTRPYKAS